MFKLLIFITCVYALANADNIDKDAEIRSLQNDGADADGNYHYAYETSNGIQVQEAGNANGVRGTLSYVSPEGEHIELTYTADEEGYHPVGDHLPTPPPVPQYILRSLEYIREHPPANLDKDLLVAPH